MTTPDSPLEEVLAGLERGRRARIATLTVALAATAVVAVLVLVTPGTPTPLTWVAVGALVVVDVAYAVSVIARERAADRATRGLLAARAEAAAERARERALEGLHAATRTIAATLDLPEVTDLIVTRARELVDASSAELQLHVPDSLVTAATTGPGVVPRGTRRPVDGAAAEALAGGHVVARGRGGSWGDGAPALLAPVVLPDRVVGVLTVSRRATAGPFSPADRLALELLAEHAALALRNATRHDRLRQQVDAFAAIIGELGVDDVGLEEGPPSNAVGE